MGTAAKCEVVRVGARARKAFGAATPGGQHDERRPDTDLGPSSPVADHEAARDSTQASGYGVALDSRSLPQSNPHPSTINQSILLPPSQLSRAWAGFSWASRWTSGAEQSAGFQPEETFATETW